MALSERKLKILQAVINDYVLNAEPVGSRTLSKRHDLGISPATIRNEMADLEDMGYLTHPHTSAGRVPSDKAYRLYVNNLMERDAIDPAEKQIINERLRQDLGEFDATLRHAAALLSEITNLASFAMTPQSSQDKLNFIKLMPFDDDSVVLMIVSESGNITNQRLKINMPYTNESLDILSKSMTYQYKGTTIDEALKTRVIIDAQDDLNAMSMLADSVMPNFIKSLEDMLNVNLYMEGLSNIFNIPEYSNIDRAKAFIDLVSKREEFARDLLQRDDGVMVTIGSENAEEAMQDSTLITATYHVDGRLVGKIGVIGPTRMKYSKITSIVEYLTDNLSESFSLISGKDDNKDG